MNVATEVNDAIFDNVGQAVHVAFLILAQDSVQCAPFRKALIRAMESIHLSLVQQDWLHELRGASSGTVNFGGLDGNDIRAQCALVMQVVQSQLTELELWLFTAKYGQMDCEPLDDHQHPRTEEPRRRWAFSPERIAAIEGLSDWARPQMPAVQGFAVDCLVARHFANHSRVKISVRDIAASFGGNHMRYQRAAKQLAECLQQLEQAAMERLELVFSENGVLAPF